MSCASKTVEAAEIRLVDRQLLELLRCQRMLSVSEMIDQLGVTATAIRQRLERLLEQGLIERQKVVSGRGRPTFSYQLTVEGHRRVGANPTEMAEAMWEEILAMPDTEARRTLLSRIARRLGRDYRQRLDGDSLRGRLQSLSAVLAERRIPSGVSAAGSLPVLDVASCPYPMLSDESEGRTMCHLEEEMFSEAMGQPMHLTSCRLDGDACCQFAPIAPE